MARTILDIARKCIKKAGSDAYEPSDVPVRALQLVKIGKNEGERDNIEHAKTTFEKKILSETLLCCVAVKSQNFLLSFYF